MDSKTRVKMALNYGEPDRIPFGEFAIASDTAEKILGHETYVRAKAKSQIAFWEGRRDEVVQSWKEDGVALYRKLDFLDIICVHAIAFGRVPPADYEPDPFLSTVDIFPEPSRRLAAEMLVQVMRGEIERGVAVQHVEPVIIERGSVRSLQPGSPGE